MEDADAGEGQTCITMKSGEGADHDGERVKSASGKVVPNVTGTVAFASDNENLRRLSGEVGEASQDNEPAAGGLTADTVEGGIGGPRGSLRAEIEKPVRRTDFGKGAVPARGTFSLVAIPVSGVARFGPRTEVTGAPLWKMFGRRVGS